MKGKLALLLLATLCFFRVSWAESNTVKVCTGKAYGVSYDQLIDRFLTRVFADSGLNAQIIYVPTKRAEFAFKNRNCDAFFAGTQSFDKLVQRDDIFLVDTETIRVNLELYAAKPQASGFSFNLNQLNDANTSIAFFSSTGMDRFMTQFPKAAHVPITAIEDGVKLLTKARVDYFIFPVIMSFKHDALRQVPQDNKVATLANVALYIWLDNSYLPYKVALRESVSNARESLQFKPIFRYAMNSE